MDTQGTGFNVIPRSATDRDPWYLPPYAGVPEPVPSCTRYSCPRVCLVPHDSPQTRPIPNAVWSSHLPPSKTAAAPGPAQESPMVNVQQSPGPPHLLSRSPVPGARHPKSGDTGMSAPRLCWSSGRSVSSPLAPYLLISTHTFLLAQAHSKACQCLVISGPHLK